MRVHFSLFKTAPSGAARLLLAYFLIGLGSLTNAADVPMPWAFVNGSGSGYSIKLQAALPAPGTPITVGQTTEGDTAYPAVVKRAAVQEAGGSVTMR